MTITWDWTHVQPHGNVDNWNKCKRNMFWEQVYLNTFDREKGRWKIRQAKATFFNVFVCVCMKTRAMLSLVHFSYRALFAWKQHSNIVNAQNNPKQHRKCAIAHTHTHTKNERSLWSFLFFFEIIHIGSLLFAFFYLMYIIYFVSPMLSYNVW